MSVQPGEVERVVAVQLGRRDVSPGDRLREDLGAESADLLNLIAALEDRYGIDVDDQALEELMTVADLCTLVAERLADR